MKKILLLVVVCGIAITIGGCTTTGNIRVPQNTKLYLDNRPDPVEVKADGAVTTVPFAWRASGGISYRLEKRGAQPLEGKLQAAFRPVSIFWPPFAIIYWPMGFKPDMTYDLTKGTQNPPKGTQNPPKGTQNPTKGTQNPTKGTQKK